MLKPIKNKFKLLKSKNYFKFGPQDALKKNSLSVEVLLNKISEMLDMNLVKPTHSSSSVNTIETDNFKYYKAFSETDILLKNENHDEITSNLDDTKTIQSAYKSKNDDKKQHIKSIITESLVKDLTDKFIQNKNKASDKRIKLYDVKLKKTYDDNILFQFKMPIYLLNNYHNTCIQTIKSIDKKSNNFDSNIKTRLKYEYKNRLLNVFKRNRKSNKSKKQKNKLIKENTITEARLSAIPIDKAFEDHHSNNASIQNSRISKRSNTSFTSKQLHNQEEKFDNDKKRPEYILSIISIAFNPIFGIIYLCSIEFISLL